MVSEFISTLDIQSVYEVICKAEGVKPESWDWDSDLTEDGLIGYLIAFVNEELVTDESREAEFHQKCTELEQLPEVVEILRKYQNYE